MRLLNAYPENPCTLVLGSVRRFRIFIILVLLVLAVPLPVGAQGDWVIDGDKVYVNDTNVYLSASPHTIGSSSWVEFELLSKNYEGEIDAVWGFDTSTGVIPKKSQLWAKDAPHTKYYLVDVEKGTQITIYNIIDYVVLVVGSVEPDIGKGSNTKLVELTVASIEGSPASRNPFTIAYNSYQQLNATTATFYYNEIFPERESYIEYYDDWIDWDANFNVVQHEYKGMDKWWILKLDKPIEKNTLYKVRAWVEVPFAGLQKLEGKYFWGVKPSSETVNEAIANGHAYWIDPWYDTQWLYRAKLIFDNSASAENLIDKEVRVYFNAANFDFTQVQADADDVVFTDSDGATLLPHLIDSWSVGSELGQAWVKVPQIDAGSTTDSIYVYWGNSSATNIENGEFVFGGYETISNCENLVSWTVTGATSTLSVDGAVKTEGLFSVKDTVVSATDTIYRLLYNPADALNMSKQDSALDFQFSCSLANTSFASSKAYIYTTDSAYYSWNITYSANTWTYFTKTMNSRDNEAGAVDCANIDYIVFEIIEDGAAANFNFQVDQIEHRWGVVFAGVYKDSPIVTLLTNTGFEDGDPPTGWALDGAGATWAQSIEQVYRGTYSGKLTRVGTNCTAYQVYAEYAKYKGLQVTLKAYVYATVAARARIYIYDGIGSGVSSYHSGVAGWELLTASKTIDVSATRLEIYVQVRDGDTSAYFDEASLKIDNIFMSHDHYGHPVQVLGAEHIPNYGYLFDGVDDIIVVPDHAAIQNIFDGAGGTILAWIKPDSDGEGDIGTIMRKTTGATLNGWWFSVEQEAAGFVKLNFYQYFSTTEGSWKTTNAIVPVGVWSLVAVTYDADLVANNPILYVGTGGVLTAYTVGSGLTETTTPIGTRGSDVGHCFTIGNLPATSRTFDGYINALWAFKGKMLSQIELQNLFLAATDSFVAWSSTEGKPSAPTNFIVVENGDTRIDMTWTKGTLAVNTVIRRSVDSYPVNITDGIEVYNDTGTSFSDTPVDNVERKYYYSAWSYSDWGYSDDYMYGLAGGMGMVTIGSGIVILGLFALAGILSWMALRSRNLMLALGGAICWMLIFAYTRDNPIPNVTIGSFADVLVIMLCWAAAIALLFMTFQSSRRESEMRERGYYVGGDGDITPDKERQLAMRSRSKSPMEMSTEEYRADIRRKLRRRRR